MELSNSLQPPQPSFAPLGLMSPLLTMCDLWGESLLCGLLRRAALIRESVRIVVTYTKVYSCLLFSNVSSLGQYMPEQ